MQYLTLGDIRLGLEDLQKDRATLLQSCKIGQVYQILLMRSLERLHKLPAVLFSNRPLTTELASADSRHDSGVTKLRETTDGVIKDAFTEREFKEAAQRIQRDLVPSAKIVGASYPTEASNAKKRRQSLKDREADLKLFPLVGGRTLYDAAVQFLDAGDELDALLSERAKQEAISEADRSEAGQLRNTVVGYLVRFNTALEDELEANEKLPRNLASLILGYFEQINETRRAQKQG
jgi:hypothetical protein